MIAFRHIASSAITWFVLAIAGQLAAAEPANTRRPKDAADLKYWLENMIWHHRFTVAEVEAATGLNPEEIAAAVEKHQIVPERRPARAAAAPLLVLPYPGGRHPRIGFLEGAIDPQRETKVSVFTPWDPDSYVVVDLPEAIWWEKELLYLAHSHVPTLWTKQQIELQQLEWTRHPDGRLTIERKLPNQIRFAASVRPGKDAVQMTLEITNGAGQTLTGLRVQNCLMLKGVAGFNQQTNENKVLTNPYCACRSTGGKRWIITAWSSCLRPWGNERCPCLHSDPKFPDCPPGETRTLRGWLSFYEGDDLQAELRRIDALAWQRGA